MPLRQPPAEQPFSLIPPNWNPVSNDRVLPRLEPINSNHTSGPFHIGHSLAGAHGTGSAEHKNGKHANKRAPAAITSLSAASRCASRPPSDPSVYPPFLEPGQK